MKRLIIITLFTLFSAAAVAQSKVGISYYDMGPLYDTIPSLFYNDEYTPEGERRWNGSRYRESVERYAALLDRMQMNIVGVYGVENEQVALDLAAASHCDYTVLHSTSTRMDGIDFALFYHADRLFPKRVNSGAGWFSVVGELDGVEVAILLARGCKFVDELIEEFQAYGLRVILLGDSPPSDALNLEYAHREAEREGRGNAFIREGWRCEDAAWIDSSLRVKRADYYISRELVDGERFRPIPLYYRGNYKGGYSWKLPLFLYLIIPNLED